MGQSEGPRSLVKDGVDSMAGRGQATSFDLPLARALARASLLCCRLPLRQQLG